MSTTTARRAVTNRKTSKRRRKRRARGLWVAASIVLLLGLAVLLFFGLRGGYDTYVRSNYELEHYDTVMQACEDFGMPPSLVYGVIRTESGFDERAHSVADARGLMQVTQTGLEWTQIRSDEFDEVTVDDLYDPAINIRCGVFLLSLLFEEFESEQAVIAAYNAGIGNVEEWLSDTAYSDDGITLHTIPFEETRNYIKRVTSSKGIYQYYYQINDTKGDS